MKTTTKEKLPHWVTIKESMKELHTETDLILVGELGVSGITNGMLPNGTPYVWEKRRDKMRKRLFVRKRK